MTEAHQPPLLRERLLGERVHVGDFPDLDERPHDRFPGAAVQRTLQRADAARDRRVHVGVGRRDHARRERRRVELVLGVEREARIERLHRRRRRARPCQHVEEVGGVRQIGRGRHGVLAAPHAMVRRDGGGELCREPDRLAVVRRG